MNRQKQFEKDFGELNDLFMNFQHEFSELRVKLNLAREHYTDEEVEEYLSDDPEALLGYKIAVKYNEIMELLGL